MTKAKLSWNHRKKIYDIAEGLLGESEKGKRGEKKLVDILRDYQASLLQRDASSRLRRLFRVNRQAAAAVGHIEKAVRGGRSFTVAMGASLGPMERTIIGSGERSSTLPSAMRMVLELHQMLGDIRWQFVSSMSQPLVYILAIYGFLLVLGGFVVPQYALFYPAEKWTGWAAVMLALSKVATGWAPIVAAVLFVGAVVGIAWALPRWTGRGRAFADKYVFPFSSYRYVSGTAWLLTFSVLLKAGVIDKSALSEQMQFGSPWLASRLKPIRDGIVGGKSLASAMRETKTDFPTYDLIEAIKSREESEEFAEKIEAVARKEMVHMRRRFIVTSVIWGAVLFVVLIGVVFVLQLGVNDLTTDSATAVGSF
ncbi:type II secretion system F family protein [Burkholderia cenocepacia]|uniref:type II secretion system F family protein n=1 Tax=Burkholderia cenocepacia TaxID=95486 RepID=UPI001B9C9929|nr:type II secretion system F family protein [Burkholderia cenocepacia]MBR7989491.1 type II secretion system F family protein [Burkholderia cenocepacia]